MRRKNDPSIAVAYRRVSTDDQANGLEAQREQIEAWCRRSSVTLLATYEDSDVSGGLPLAQRPALLDALADVRAFRAGVVIVAKRDRIARDVGIVRDIERSVNMHGARLVSADGASDGETAGARMHRAMLDVYSEYERGVIGERTAAALARKRARGERTGGHVPYGFDAVNGRLEPNAREQAIIATIRDLQRDGLTLAQIVRTLECKGVVNRVGKPLHRKSVERIIAHVPPPPTL